MKATLEFNLPEEREEFETAQQAWKYKAALEEMWERIFRPRHKHGYGIENLDSFNSKQFDLAMNDLEKIYHEIVEDYEL